MTSGKDTATSPGGMVAPDDTSVRVWTPAGPGDTPGGLGARYVRLFASVYRHRSLVWSLTLREIQGRYRGSYLGIAWSFVHPLVMLALYTFVFGVVFKARWPEGRGSEGLAGFALVLFAGHSAFQLFSEPVARAASLVVGVPSYVKKVVFPLEILPFTVVGAALFQFALSCTVLLGGVLLLHGSLTWPVLLLPVAMLPLLMLTLGTVAFLAALGAYVRDVGFAVGVGLQILFFATPIFYHVSAIPERYRWLANLNPLTPCVGAIRSCLLSARPPEPGTLLLAGAYGAAVLIVGFGWFMVCRRGFADVV